jgi:hypothetical protein
MTVDEYLEKPYWVIDILPKQVPADSKGQYFKIEEYYLEHPQIDVIYKKFTNVLLKLNCYEEIDVCQNGENWMTNPAPKDIEAMLLKCLSDESMLTIYLKSLDALITIRGDDTYMTVYNPSEETIELLRSLATSEGLFIWNPELKNEEDK